MRQKIKTIYETPGELKAAIDDGTIKVGDEFETFDIEDDAIFVVANVGRKKVWFIRKYLLEQDRPMKTDEFDLMTWLNGEYKNTLIDGARELLHKGKVTLPSEAQVFGENKYGRKEYRKQWDYFKKTRGRIATHKPDEEYSKCWWTRTPYYDKERDVVSGTNFAVVYGGGFAGYAGASGSLGIRPAFAVHRS